MKKTNKPKAVKSIRGIKKEQLRLEYELKLASQQLKIRSLEIKSQLQMDKLLFLMFKKALRSIMGRFRKAEAEKSGEN